MRRLWKRSARRHGRLCTVFVLIWTLIFLPTLFAPQRALAAFVKAPSAHFPTTTDATNSFAVGDVDGDGDPDVIVVNAGQSFLLLNNGQGQFSDVTGDHLPTLTLTAMAATLGDVDGDSDLDLVLANARGSNRLLLNDGHGIFTDVTDAHLPSLTQVSMSVQLGDVDGDGDLDLAVANRGSQNRLFLNDGTGVFTDATATHLPSDSALSYDVEFTDVDGNRTLDLVVANHGTPNRLLRNNGLGVFTDITADQLPAVSGNSMDALLSDIDADGDVDLLFTAGATALLLFLNDGMGRFMEATATHLPALNAFGIKVLAGDIDSDGDADLVLAAAGQDHVLLNDGGGRFNDATADFLPIDADRSLGKNICRLFFC
jgi:FG-GAP-like repeat/FG-GAP repeat